MRPLLLLFLFSACASFRAVEMPTDPRRNCELACLAALTAERPDWRQIDKACGPCPGDPPETHPPDDPPDADRMI